MLVISLANCCVFEISNENKLFLCKPHFSIWSGVYKGGCYMDLVVWWSIRLCGNIVACDTYNAYLRFSFMYWFYGRFKIISFISSRSLIRSAQKTGYPEKNHLTFRCRTWRLACDPSQARTTAVIKSQRSHPLGHGGPFTLLLCQLW